MISILASGLLLASLSCPARAGLLENAFQDAQGDAKQFQDGQKADKKDYVSRDYYNEEIGVSVIDKDGLPVDSEQVSRGAFHLLEDGVEQKILKMKHDDDAPANVLLIFEWRTIFPEIGQNGYLNYI